MTSKRDRKLSAADLVLQNVLKSQSQQNPSLQTIAHLTDKIMLHILGYLDHRLILKCAEVCKRWRTLAHDPRLWQVISLRPGYGGLQV